jgi:hypothetical protein
MTDYCAGWCARPRGGRPPWVPLACLATAPLTRPLDAPPNPSAPPHPAPAAPPVLRPCPPCARTGLPTRPYPRGRRWLGSVQQRVHRARQAVVQSMHKVQERLHLRHPPPAARRVSMPICRSCVRAHTKRLQRTLSICLCADGADAPRGYVYGWVGARAWCSMMDGPPAAPAAAAVVESVDER